MPSSTLPTLDISRRALLGSTLALGAAASVGPALLRTGPAASAATTTSTTPTISTLAAGNPFYIAHRGGGRDWPQMTGYAYQQAAMLPGLQAIEVSACITKDGVLVCSHDPNTLSATGYDAVIGNVNWADISTLLVRSSSTLDPKQPARPITKYSSVIYNYLSKFVVFAEPKTSAAAVNLMYNLKEMAQPQRTVWKQPINSTRFAEAKKNGFSTWGYVLNEPDHLGANLTRYAASEYIDALGAPLSESDDFIKAIVDAAGQNGKPTIAWAISTTADRDRALRLGCKGLMTSEIRGLLNTTAGQPARA